jgi:hypothetical protein
VPQGKLYIDTTGRITATILKDDGTALAGSVVTALTLTIRNRDASNTVINGRNESALTPVATYLSEAGALTIDLLPADNVLIDSTKYEEVHRVIVKWTYTGGAKGLLAEDYNVQNPAAV